MVTGDCIHSSRGTQRQFPPYTLKTLFRLSRVLLEMHSKWRYKICICSATEGKLESTKLQEIQLYYSQNFRGNLTYYESENFSNCSLHHIF